MKVKYLAGKNFNRLTVSAEYRIIKKHGKTRAEWLCNCICGKEVWEKIYKGNDNVKVIIIPNVKSVKYGRSVGFSIEEIKPPSDIANISATQIRKDIQSGSDSWKTMVSKKIHEDLERLLK